MSVEFFRLRRHRATDPTMPASVIVFDPECVVAIFEDVDHDDVNDEDEEIYDCLDMLLDELGIRHLEEAYVCAPTPKSRYELRIDGRVYTKSPSYLALEREAVPDLRRRLRGDQARTIEVFDRRIGAVCLTTNAGGTASSCL